VPASSGVYDQLESVSAFFPVRGLFLGERPMSRRDVIRAIALLERAIDSAPPALGAARKEWARRELGAVAGAMNRERGVYRSSRTVVAFTTDEEVTRSDAQPERITSNGLGSIDAVTQAFEAARQGSAVSNGTTVITRLTGVLSFHEHLAAALQPRLSFADSRNDSVETDLRLPRAYARGTYRNIALRVGADELKWGQSPRGSMFISGNAAPLPALTVGTDTPFTLPWVFRLVGPVRGTAMLADLGRLQDPPHDKLVGWQVSFEPWSRFELGVAVLSQMGGKGGPQATFFQRVVDLFPLIDAIAPQHADLQISNKVAGGNLRLRFPELSGLDFYYELQIDDFDIRRLRSSLVEDAGHLLGARLPLLVRDGQLALRAEWHRTSLRLYEHAQFRSGMTYREHIIGNPLGPNGKGGYLNLTWQPSPERLLDIAVADEIRDPSQYMTTANSARDEGFRFVRLSDDPDFHRRRITGVFEQRLRFGGLRTGLGVNRAWRVGAAPRNEWQGQIALRSHFFPTF